MITKYKIFESINEIELSYDEVFDFLTIKSKIKNYLVTKYDNHTSFIGTKRFFSKSTIKAINRTLKFADKNNDKELENLVLIYKDTKKYNL